MTWTMPPETAPQDCVWMAFPRENAALGDTTLERESCYGAWSDIANEIAQHVPVRMVVDPSEAARAQQMLSGEIERLAHPLDDFWMRDMGPTFVQDAGGALAAVDWVFNAWGAGAPADYQNDAKIARFVADAAGVPCVPSKLVNEGGGIHVDGAGSVLATQTVQLGPERNPGITAAEVEAEFARTLGAPHTIWLPRGLTRDYDPFGTKGHVDIVACFTEPERILLHAQPGTEHPDHAVMQRLRSALSQAVDAKGRRLQITDLPAPSQLRDAHGFVDYSYVNHLVTNGAVIACAFGDAKADAQAAEILAEAYPGRTIVSCEARPLFARGGGIHCITQQQPKASPL